jgi:hypothetical protein
MPKSNIIERLKATFATRHASARQKYVDLLRRSDTEEGDALDELHGLMVELGKDADDVQADLQALATVDALEAQRGDIATLTQLYRDARAELVAYDKATEELAAARREGRAAVEKATGRAQAHLQTANAVNQEISNTKAKRRDLFA